MRDESEDLRRVGRDEMNLSEFPITLLAERVPQGLKTLAFEDQHGRLTVSGSNDYGLPTALDSDVIVALIQLTKLRNDFADPTVTFTRYELLKLLGWPDQTHFYRRLSESLHRWVGVTLRYDGCWWDNRRKRKVDASFHILEYVVLPDADDPDEPSSFAWNKIFFKSCRDGNLKRLDLGTYFALKSAVSKQLYRFLDKRFYHRGEWTFDLRELAHERVGLSRSYAVGDIKRKLNRALDELEGIGFLTPMSTADRYSKAGRGAWNIRIIRKLPTPAEAKPPEPEPTDLERELIDRGVTLSQAAALVREYPKDRVREQIRNLDGRRRKVKDPGAWLASAIRKGYAMKAEPVVTRVEPVAASVIDQAERERVKATNAFWAGLTADERKRIDAEALAQADPAARADYEAETDRVKRRLKMVPIRNAYLDTLPVAG
jgi:Replication initiator protein A